MPFGSRSSWLLYAACMTAATLLFAGAASGVVNELSFYLATVGLSAIPAAVAIGILGHDLLDLDTVINRTVVYAMLTLGVAAVYVLVAAGFGTVIDETVPVGVSLVATAAVAVLLVPMRGDSNTSSIAPCSGRGPTRRPRRRDSHGSWRQRGRQPRCCLVPPSPSDVRYVSRRSNSRVGAVTSSSPSLSTAPRDQAMTACSRSPIKASWSADSR